MNDKSNEKMSKEERLQMVADIVTAYVSHNPLPSSHLPEVIATVHESLAKLETGDQEEPAVAQKPAVPIKRSITDDYIICLEDGKQLKMLKRYLRTKYDMTPEQYRAKWNLPADYPMVAPSYSRRRSQFAKDIGLGRGGRSKN